MASFTVEGVEYELLTFDSLDQMTMGDLRVLEEEGGLDLAALTAGDIQITTRLLLALLLLSMRRVNPAASMGDAEKVSMSVLADLGALVANSSSEEEAPPPTPAAVAAGLQP